METRVGIRPTIDAFGNISMLRIANRGVHGEIISQKYMEFASQAYPQIIDGLDNCKEWIRLLIDATVGS